MKFNATVSQVDGSILVLGYGNELRGDDGAGPWVAARIADLGIDAVRVRIAHQLLPEFASDLAESAAAIFVDARAGDEGDGVSATRIEPADGGTGCSAHDLTPRQLLTLSKKLFGRVPAATLVAIPGCDFSLKSGLSPCAENHCRAAVAIIKDLIASAQRDQRLPPRIRDAKGASGTRIAFVDSHDSSRRS